MRISINKTARYADREDAILKKSLRKSLGGFSIVFAALAGPALAEFPEKEITVTVGFGPGGGVDTITRAAADALSSSLGQAVVVTNQPGAGGGLALTALKAKPADGYNLAAAISTTISFDPHSANVSYGIDDFEYIGAFGVFPEALVALPSRDWNDFKDVIAAAKDAPDGFTYASTTSLDRVVMKSISAKEGVVLKPVPTKGGAEAVAAVLGGHVDFAYSSGTYYAQAAAGALHVLAGLGTNPIPGFEGAPTLKSLGYDISSVNMVIYAAPAGIPDDAKAKLVAAFEAAAQSKPVLDVLAKRNMGSFTLTGAAFDEQIRAQSAQFKAAME
ncbi:tripartite tricarboxylate transporter substrate binding protein [Antarcticimicrobium sediminis]|uniref:tripartite tricarboxylate transporter substrate binding protein n=1 Tax=Antarcticimicrobium sediminis TaxID=2546227 RepID=UPI001404B02A|nr:tripartite tricarboxylate transporter substrate binding protein [Antarcticimicrobium sediminis]